MTDVSSSVQCSALLGPRISRLLGGPRQDGVYLFDDPRTPLLGLRALARRPAAAAPLPADVPQEDEEVYSLWRHLLGVAEGPEEMPAAHVLPLEANLEYLHGVSFDKGCYLGQELTARTHHTGVIRKRFMPCLVFPRDAPDAAALTAAVAKELAAAPADAPLFPPSLFNRYFTTAPPTPAGANLLAGEKNVGRILSRAVESNLALALVRLEHLQGAEPLLADGSVVKPLVPAWWPRSEAAAS